MPPRKRASVNMDDDNFYEQVEENAAAQGERRAEARGLDETGAELAPVDRGEALVPTVAGTIVAEGKPSGQGMDMGLSAGIDDEYEDEDAAAEMAYRGIINQILGSESIEEILTPPDAVNARDMVGVPLIIRGFHVNRSEYDVGSPVYFSMDVVRGTDMERLVVNCGNQRVMAQLMAMYLRDIESPVKTVEGLSQVKMPPDVTFTTPAEAYIRQATRPNRHGSLPLSLDSRPPSAWK